MTRRLLILSDPYSRPSFAPRLRYLCDYLTRRGWQVEVYTERFAEITFRHDYPIHEIRLYRSKADRLLKMSWSLLTNWKERQFCMEVRRLIQGKEYDAVFCTTFSTFPLGTALNISEERCLSLYVDIRDLDEQIPGQQYLEHRTWWTKPFRQWYKRVNKRRRNEVIRKAKSVTTISPWHVDFLKALNPNVHLVYNGYDPHRFIPRDIETDLFRVAYIGKIYAFQDLSPVEEAIRRIGNPEIVLSLHTPDCQPIGTNEVPDEIRRSSIMVVLTSKDAKGMMTTKFFEALGCEKPVLCVPDDESVLSQTIRDTSAGISADSVEEVEAFIREKYAEWKVNGFTRQAVNQEMKNSFSREEEARMMEELLCC